VLVSHPIAIAVHSAHIATTCHSCLAHLQSLPDGGDDRSSEESRDDNISDDDAGRALRCQLCDSAVYCDAACRAKDAPLHALECALRGASPGADIERKGAATENQGNVNNNRNAHKQHDTSRRNNESNRGMNHISPALVVDEVWTTRLMARAVAWLELNGGADSYGGSSNSSSRSNGGGGGGRGKDEIDEELRVAEERGDVLWGLEPRTNMTLDAAAREIDTLGKIARMMCGGLGGTKRGNSGSAAAASVKTLRHIHGVVVNNAIGVVRLPGRLTERAVEEDNKAGSSTIDGGLGQWGKLRDTDRAASSPSASLAGCLSTSSSLAPRAVAAALYVEASMVNHSCRPNCAWTFEIGGDKGAEGGREECGGRGGRGGGGERGEGAGRGMGRFVGGGNATIGIGGGTMQLRVVAQHVAPGESLTVSYVHPLVACQPVRVRRARIAAQFGFICRCDACTSESIHAIEDDATRTEVGVSWLGAGGIEEVRSDVGRDRHSGGASCVDNAIADLRSFLKHQNLHINININTETNIKPSTAAATAAVCSFDIKELCRLWAKMEMSVMISKQGQPQHTVTSFHFGSNTVRRESAVSSLDGNSSLLNTAWDVMNALEKYGGGQGVGGGNTRWPALSDLDALSVAASACACVRWSTERRGVGYAPDVLRARRLEKEWLGCILSRGFLAAETEHVVLPAHLKVYCGGGDTVGGEGKGGGCEGAGGGVITLLDWYALASDSFDAHLRLLS